MPSAPRRLQLTAGLGLLGLALLLLSPFVASPYLNFLAAQMIAMTYIAVSLQLSYAYARILSFAQGTFFAFGAYAAIHVFRSVQPELVLMLLAGVATAMIVGLLVALLVTRMKGAHTAVIGTLLIASIAYMAAGTSIDLTGGEDGLALQGALTIGGWHIAPGVHPVTYFIALLPLAVYLGASLYLQRSIFGVVMRAVGENEIRASQMGFNVRLRHLLVFTFGAGLSGYGGAIYPVLMQHVSSGLFDPSLSLTGVLWATVGGLGSPFGALIGAMIVFPATELVSGVVKYVDIAVGALLVVTALFFPKGIAGTLDEVTGVAPRDFIMREVSRGASIVSRGRKRFGSE